MEKSSRVNKYRSLRESLKEDATLPKQDIQEPSDEIDDTKIPTLREYRMKQFVQEVKDYEGDQENELDGVKSELESKEIEEAIGRVRMTSGKGEQYNTRLDILNHIQSGAIKKVDKTPIVVPLVEEDEPEEEVLLEPVKEVVEEKTEEPVVVEPVPVEPVKHFKIFFEDEEEEEETKEVEPAFEEEEEKEEKRSLFKRHKVFEEDEIDDIEDEEELEGEEEGSSVTMKVLTGMIVVLSICLVALLGYIIKLFLF